MNDYLNRMIKENDQLLEKISKLQAFIETNNTFKTLSVRKQDLLRQQYYAMQNYCFILMERIDIEQSELIQK